MNAPSFCLSGNVFISPSILKEIQDNRYRILGLESLPFSTLTHECTVFWPPFLKRNLKVILSGIPSGIIQWVPRVLSLYKVCLQHGLVWIILRLSFGFQWTFWNSIFEYFIKCGCDLSMPKNQHEIWWRLRPFPSKHVILTFLKQAVFHWMFQS